MPSVDYIGSARGSSRTFVAKTQDQQAVLNEALDILKALGVPVDPAESTSRTLEKMALAFVALCDVTSPGAWHTCRDVNTRALQTREVIRWENLHFGEDRSEGSYDDVRRAELRLPFLAGVVAQPESHQAKNDPTRGWGIASDIGSVVRAYGTSEWDRAVKRAMKGRPSLIERLAMARDLPVHSVQLPNDLVVGLGGGDHNELIKSVIEEFLPIFGYDAEVLYVGDASDRMLHIATDQLTKLGVFDLDAGELLPDVIAYSARKKWLYVIEAVHSSGPVSPEKHLLLQDLLDTCNVPVVYVTAFATMAKFAKFADAIAWETEVWVSSHPTHLIHFNGEKFLGPHV